MKPDEIVNEALGKCDAAGAIAGTQADTGCVQMTAGLGLGSQFENYIVERLRGLAAKYSEHTDERKALTLAANDVPEYVSMHHSACEKVREQRHLIRKQDEELLQLRDRLRLARLALG